MKSKKRRRFPVFLAGACVVMLLTGCGENESIHMDADTQTEEMTETDNAAEEITGSATGAASEDTDKDTVEETEEDTAGVVSDTELQMETSAARNQMEIDEETRRELTEQLLEEEKMDTSVMDEKRTTKGCTFDIPEGFEESEEVENMYVTRRYPIDASTIYYAVMDGDISLQLLTEENFKEQAEEDLKQAYDEDVEIALDSFEHITISGYPAFRILCHYNIGTVEITQLHYAINADKSYMITYSQTSDYDYMEAYEASAATIQVE